MKECKLLILFCLFISCFSHASDGFNVVALGVNGGISDGNLTAFYIAPTKDNHQGVMCDAGTLVKGAQVAFSKKSLVISQPKLNSQPINEIGSFIKQDIKGYLITHSHLDHVAGLVIASPDDSAKPIYALPKVIDELKANYFNWRAWPNFGNSGAKPTLNKYSYVPLTSYDSIAIANTAMKVTAYPLSHSGILSTAFLIEHGNNAILCIGDTGADVHERANNLEQMWGSIVNKLQGKTLQGIIVESSFSNEHPEHLLFGHLTPKLILATLTKFVQLSGEEQYLKGVKVIISHIKYSLTDGNAARDRIRKQLNSGNTLGVTFVLPEQGDLISLH